MWINDCDWTSVSYELLFHCFEFFQVLIFYGIVVSETYVVHFIISIIIIINLFLLFIISNVFYLTFSTWAPLVLPRYYTLEIIEAGTVYAWTSFSFISYSSQTLS